MNAESNGAPRRRLIALTAVCILIAGAWGRPQWQAEEAQSVGEEDAAPARPNIILVLTDDLDRNLGTLARLPKLKALLADRGITFPNMFVSESLCCPSRASILRGQFVHNHKVAGNRPPEGGFEKFHALREEQSTVATWLHAAGYRTGFMGKYLNGYPEVGHPTFVPPGWDEWDSPAAGNPYNEFNYTMNENGSLVRYGARPEDYLTDVLSLKATRFISMAARDGHPFFLFVATYAPHLPATPAPRHALAFLFARAPRLPSFNEPDVSDKPEWVRTKPLLEWGAPAVLDSIHRRRLRSMLAVQQLVERLLKTLQATGQIENTYVFFTSDNGFHLGEHRMHAGKLTAYEEDIRVPLFVRGPGVPAGRVRGELVANVDLAPTFAALVRAPMPDFVDGRSMVPLLRASPLRPRWRRAFLIEQEQLFFSPARSARPRMVLEPLDPQEEQMAAATQPLPQPLPAYSALRTRTLKYVVYSTGERELYHLPSDPFELENRANTVNQDLVARLDSWLEALRECHGALCRAIDTAPPR